MANKGLTRAYDLQRNAQIQDSLAGGGGVQDTGLGELLGTAKQIVGAMGLFGAARDTMDDIQLKTRVGEMNDVLSKTGDINAIPQDMAKGRVGAQAMAHVTDLYTKTKEGQLKLQEIGQKSGVMDYNNLTAGLAQADAYAAAGDNDGVIRAIETASTATGAPYRHKHVGDGMFQQVFTGDPSGVDKPMGEPISAQDLLTQTRAALKDQPKFMQMVQQVNAANMGHNLDVQRNPDKWMRVTEIGPDGKEGKARDLIPFLNMTPGQSTHTGYYDPTSGKSYNSVEELMAPDEKGSRFSAPESKAGSLKSEAAALAAEKAANANELGLQKLAMQGEVNAMRKTMAGVQAEGAISRLDLAQRAQSDSDQNKVTAKAEEYARRQTGLGLSPEKILVARTGQVGEDGKAVLEAVDSAHQKYAPYQAAFDQYIVWDTAAKAAKQAGKPAPAIGAGMSAPVRDNPYKKNVLATIPPKTN